MVKYKVNLKFKDTEKTLNEIIMEALKIEIKNRFNKTCINLKIEMSPCSTHNSQKEWRII